MSSLLTDLSFAARWFTFQKKFLFGERLLVIISYKNQPKEDRLSLLVEKLLADPFADCWPSLDNNLIFPKLSVEIPLSQGKSIWVLQSFIHDEVPNFDQVFTLEHRIIEGQTRWRPWLRS